MKTCPGRMSWIGSRASQTEGLRQTDGETLSDGELLSYNRPSHKKQLATRGCLAALGRGDTNDDREREEGARTMAAGGRSDLTALAGRTVVAVAWDPASLSRARARLQP